MTEKPSLTPDYFERMFAKDDDPWNLESSDYETAKYDVTLAALGDRAYQNGFEIGCAGGMLTKRFAGRCRSLLAIDASASALARARVRCHGNTNIAFAETVFPREQPDGLFDLIVMSEVVYYWNDADIARACAYVDSHLQPSGDLLLVHWTGETDYPQSGADAVRLMRGGLRRYEVVRAERHEKYRLDLLRKP